MAVIDVRGRGDCSIAYPARGRHYFPNRIPNEAYLTWFTLMLGKPLLGGQVFDALRAVDYLRSRQDIAGGAISLVGDGAHGVIALYAAALDEKVRGVALRQTVTDYRSLASAERYTQPFGIYAYGLLRAFDLPQVARAVGPRPVFLLNPVTATRRAGRPRRTGSLRVCSERHGPSVTERRGPGAGSDVVADKRIMSLSSSGSPRRPGRCRAAWTASACRPW